MQEETKEEFLARHRKGVGMVEKDEEPISEAQPAGIKSRLKGLFFLLLLALFLWAIFQIFGMLKSN